MGLYPLRSIGTNTFNIHINVNANDIIVLTPVLPENVISNTTKNPINKTSKCNL